MLFNNKALLALTVVFNLHASEYQNANLKTFLKEFHENTKVVMNQLPYKKSIAEFSPFLKKDIENKNFVEAKDQIRKKFCKIEEGSEVCLDGLEGKAQIEANDRASSMVENGTALISNLAEMDAKNLHQKKVSKQPWSDDYWPIYAGILGKRYADLERGYTSDWKEAKNYVELKPVSNYLENNLTDLLSPSEKYDLLVGDNEGTLTKKMWEEGEEYYLKNGSVETWMGICHGWAPASYMLDRPTQKIAVMSVDQKTVVNFYPSDIKALGSLLWANAQTPSKFIGSRCNDKNPAVDESSGRITDIKCFDTNPGTWHQTIVNQIGVSDHSFIMDATFDYQVWNQPIISYNYKYFNVKTAETFTTWAEAKVKVKDYEEDKFKKYRNTKSKYFVGVEMSVVYLRETTPNHTEINSEENDATNEVIYRYDLEVDANGNIIGGEWYANGHPDFMWTPAVSRATSYADSYLNGEWASQISEQVYTGIPSDWSSYALSASNYAMPLAKVVEGLILRSNEKRE